MNLPDRCIDLRHWLARHEDSSKWTKPAPLNGSATWLRDLASLAREQCWTVSVQNSGHIAWENPARPNEKEVTSATTSDPQAFKHITHQLKSFGLITDTGEWKRYKKRLRLMTTLRQEALKPSFMRESFKKGAAFEELMGDLDPNDFATLTDAQLNALSIWMCETKVLADDLAICDCPCGFIDSDILKISWHRYKCKRIPMPADPRAVPDTVKEITVERKADQKPPDRDRIDCRRCNQWFWVSQKAQYEAHLKSAHQIVSCPECYKEMQETSLSQHVKQNCTVAKRRRREAEAERRPGPRFSEGDWSARNPRTTADLPAVPEDLPTRLPDGGSGSGGGKVLVAAAFSDRTGAGEAAGKLIGPLIKKAPAHEATDDELWALLELVLDGPVPLNRETLAKVNEWFDATRSLFALKNAS